jgi:hypothetical protein
MVVVVVTAVVDGRVTVVAAAVVVVVIGGLVVVGPLVVGADAGGLDEFAQAVATRMISPSVRSQRLVNDCWYAGGHDVRWP